MAKNLYVTTIKTAGADQRQNSCGGDGQREREQCVQ